jgi:hypothetical protein
VLAKLVAQIRLSDLNQGNALCFASTACGHFFYERSHQLLSAAVYFDVRLYEANLGIVGILRQTATLDLNNRP